MDFERRTFQIKASCRRRYPSVQLQFVSHLHLSPQLRVHPLRCSEHQTLPTSRRESRHNIHSIRYPSNRISMRKISEIFQKNIITTWVTGFIYSMFHYQIYSEWYSGLRSENLFNIITWRTGDIRIHCDIRMKSKRFTDNMPTRRRLHFAQMKNQWLHIWDVGSKLKKITRKHEKIWCLQRSLRMTW